MNSARINTIKETFKPLIPDNNEMFTRQECIDRASAFGDASVNCIFEKEHAEPLTTWDVRNYAKSEAFRYGLTESEAFRKFDNSVSNLGYIIATYKKGINGERKARKALKLIEGDKDVKVLYNVQIGDDENQAEYDAIVFTSYGIFIVEVKNWTGELYIDQYGMLHNIKSNAKYNIPDRMSSKEAILRECIGDLYDGSYNKVLLFTGDNKITDEYNKIDICFGGGVSNRIREFKNSGISISNSDILKIIEKLENSHQEQLGAFPIDCNEYVDSFAVFLTMLEEAAEKENNRDEVTEIPDEKETEDTDINLESECDEECDDSDNLDNGKVVKYIAGGVALVSAIVGGIVYCIKKSK